MNKLMKTGVTLSTAAVLATGVTVGGALASGGGDSGPNQSPSASAASASAKMLTAKAKKKDRVYAVVNEDGSPHHGRGFVSSSKVVTDGAGVYEVFFDRSIKRCAWSGTVGRPDFVSHTGPAMITITGRVGTKNGLYVTTYDAAGEKKDFPFHAVVVCK
jgi:hypothetical protein